MSLNFIHFNSVGSTMDEARRLIQQGFHEEFAITAQQQTQGRGRHNRDWISPSGNLHMSVVTRDVPPQQLSQYALMWGAVMQQVLADLTKADVRCKWPNDVLVEGKKISGVLIERCLNPNALIVGVGVNILHLPENVLFPATCLADHGGEVINAEQLAARITDQYVKMRAHWEQNGFENIRKSWLNVAWKLNSEINIRQETRNVVGIFETIDENGALILNTHSGQEKLLVGDLVEGNGCY